MTSKAPWLSVLMPVFNGAATLSDSLESLVKENDPGIEVILVDQGSTDASLTIAQKYTGLLNLCILSAPQNRNWMQNTNLALRHASAPVCTMLHQDDLWLPGRAALARDTLAYAPNAKLWVSPALFLDPAGGPIGRFSPPFGKRPRHISRDDALSRLLVQNTVALPSALIDTGAARQVGGLDETLWYTADWDLWLKLADLAGIGWSPIESTGFRLHDGSLTLKGSRDLADFNTQLEIPVVRHAKKLPPEIRAKILRQAHLSNRINGALASGFHGPRPRVIPILAGLIGLGPISWVPFLRNSQILARTLPRLRVLGLGSGRRQHE